MPKNSSRGPRADLDLTDTAGKRPPRKSRSRKKDGPRLRLSRRVTAAYSYLLLLLLFWFVQHFMAEKHWLLAWLTYLPQHFLLIPLIPLYFGALRHKSRPALLVNSVSLLLVVFVFLGLNVPLARLAGGAPAPAPRTANLLRVMSYNCRLSNTNFEQLAAMIKRHQPDVVCLQEAPANGNAATARKLSVLFPDWYSSRNGELLTLSRHLITSARLFHVPDKKATGVLETMIDLNGHDVAVFNVHFSSPSGAGAGPAMQQVMQRRAGQLGLLIDSAEDDTMPTVIAGDFNTPPRGLIYRAMKERYTDAFREAGFGFGHTWPQPRGLMRIDYIWTSSHFEVRDCFVFGDKNSDHYPLLANLQLKQ